MVAPELLGLICVAAVRHGGSGSGERSAKGAWARLMELHTVCTLAGDRRTFQTSLGCAKNNTLALQTLEWSLNSGMVRNQDIYIPVGSVCRTDGKRPVGEESLAWSWFVASYDLLVEKKLAASLMNAILKNVLIAYVRSNRERETAHKFLIEKNVTSDVFKTFQQSMEIVDERRWRKEREEEVLLGMALASSE